MEFWHLTPPPWPPLLLLRAPSVVFRSGDCKYTELDKESKIRVNTLNSPVERQPETLWSEGYTSKRHSCGVQAKSLGENVADSDPCSCRNCGQNWGCWDFCSLARRANRNTWIQKRKQSWRCSAGLVWIWPLKRKGGQQFWFYRVRDNDEFNP